MSTFIPDNGSHYLCLNNPDSNSHFVQVKIIGWTIKSENTQPIPVTAFGPADMSREVLVLQDNGSTEGVFFFLPNGPFLPNYNAAKRALTAQAKGAAI